MFRLLEDFYDPSDLGLVITHFINTPFDQTYQSKDWKISNRMQGYPCYESIEFTQNINSYSIFKKTFEKKTNIDILYLRTFFRKIKLNELKESAMYKKDRPHQDGDVFDYAGIVYFNSNSIVDGTKLYDDMRDLEPTVIIGSKVNRCVFYNTQQPHSSPCDQHVDERWVQPFFIITKEQTYKKYMEKNNAT